MTLDWTLAVSALVFLITLAGLNWILFRPLLKTLQERRAKTEEVFEKASANDDYCQSLLDQCQAKIKAEKQAGYRLAESVREESLKERQGKTAEARDTAQAMLKEAKEAITREMQSARDGLRREAEEIAALISNRILRGGDRR